MRKFLRDWLLSRLALEEVARLAGAAALIAAYYYVDGQRNPSWLIPRMVFRIAVVCAMFPLLLEPLFYFIFLPLHALFDHVRARYAKPPGGPYCPVCGYDVRATLHHCPECGTELSWGQLPR